MMRIFADSDQFRHRARCIGTQNLKPVVSLVMALTRGPVSDSYQALLSRQIQQLAHQGRRVVGPDHTQQSRNAVSSDLTHSLSRILARYRIISSDAPVDYHRLAKVKSGVVVV